MWVRSVFAEASQHICWLCRLSPLDVCSTHLNLSSLVSSFWVCSSSCRLLTCSSFTSLISALMHWSLAYSYEENREREGETERRLGGRDGRWWTLRLTPAWLPIATALEALVSGEMGSQYRSMATWQPSLSSAHSSSFLPSFRTVHSFTAWALNK